MNTNKNGRNGRNGVLLLSACCFLLFWGGCATHLEPGGAYAPVTTNVDGTLTPLSIADVGLFAADSAFDLAVSAMDTVFKIERENRVFLWRQSPEIKHALDSIRPQAVEAKRRYAMARAAYLENPVPANLSTLQTILLEAQALTAAATAALPATGK